MEWMFVSPQNAYAEALVLNVLVMGGVALQEVIWVRQGHEGGATVMRLVSLHEQKGTLVSLPRTPPRWPHDLRLPVSRTLRNNVWFFKPCNQWHELTKTYSIVIWDLTLGETGWKIYGNSLCYVFKFFMKSKSIPNKKGYFLKANWIRNEWMKNNQDWDEHPKTANRKRTRPRPWGTLPFQQSTREARKRGPDGGRAEAAGERVVPAGKEENFKEKIKIHTTIT